MIAAITFACLSGWAAAATLPERFTLGRYVPDDVWFYVHAVHNPDRDWIEQQWMEVIQAAQDAGIVQETVELIVSSIPEEKRGELQPRLDRAFNVLRSVDWKALFSNEFVFAERLSECKMMYEYVFIVRTPEGTGETHYKSLASVIKEFAGSSSVVRLTEKDENQVQRLTLNIAEKEVQEFNVSMELFRRGDVIGFATGERSAAAVIERMVNPNEAKSLLATPRFEEAIKQVQPPTDSLMYLDLRRFVSEIREMIETVAKAKDPEGSKPAPGMPDHREAIRTVIKLMDVADYSVTTTATKDQMEYADGVMVLTQGGKDEPVPSWFLSQKPFEKFDRFIPADAAGFHISAGINLQKVYQTAMEILKKHAPEAVEAVGLVHLQLAQMGFDLERDFFSWWSGETISVELPAAMVSPMGGSDSVVMIRVKDSQIAARKVNNAIDFVIEQLKAQGQPLMVSPAKVNAEGFREITHPMLAMFIRPVVGVHQDWLMIGSSAGALNKCLAVQAGEAPSIATDEQFKKEGLVPPGPVLSASFADKSKMGNELAAAVGMMGMVGQMALMQIPESDPEAKKAKEFAGSLLKIVTKLGPVLQKIDFYSSSSTYATYDGARSVRTKSVTTYKPREVLADKPTSK